MQLIFLTHRHREADKIRRQRILFQMKEQDNITAEELSETDISSVPDSEFRIMIITILTALQKREEAF